MEVNISEAKGSRASLELLYHVSRELASAFDLQKVLQRVLLLSMKSVGGVSGSIIVLDDQGNPIESALVHTGQVYKHTTQQLKFSVQKGLAGWVLQNRKPALIPDTSTDNRWMKRPDDAPDRTGPKSALSVPLMARERVVGVITIVHPEPYTFSQTHIELVGAIADLAGIAVLNARLYAESQRQARVNTALAESSIHITEALGTEDILQRVLEQVHRALQVEAVSLYLITSNETEIVIKAATGPVAHRAVGFRLPVGQGIAGQVLVSGEGIIVENARKHSGFNTVLDQITGFETRSVACAPIRSQGKVIGVLQAINPIEGDFDADAMMVLSGIGGLAGSVIRRGQLFDRLQAAHQSFQELFEDSIDPILITDWEGNIVEANRRASEAIGLPTKPLRRMQIQSLHDVDEDAVGGQYFGSINTQETISYESRLRTGADKEIPIQVHVRQILLDEKEFYQWIFRDISERKRLDTMRDDLISMIYHDLRSPLANVLYSLEVLDTLLPKDDETYQSLIEVAVRSIERIQRLTSSLLDMKGLEAGKPIINFTETEVSDLIADAMDAISPIAESKRQKIHREIEPGLPPLIIDADMIRRVVINLLENAVKYTPTRGEIIVGSKMIPEGTQIWVEDTGPGIPPESRESIFDKFERLHSGGKGVGLGLAFCRLAVEGHGGRIWVQNGKQAGSCFAFILPERTA